MKHYRTQIHEWICIREQSLNGKNNDKNISFSPLATKEDRIHEQRKMKIHYKERRCQETPAWCIERANIGSTQKLFFYPKI